MAMALAHVPNILPHTPAVILGDNLDTVEAVNRAFSSPPPSEAVDLHTGYARHYLHIPPRPPPSPDPCGLDQRPRTLYGKRALGLCLKMGRSSINVAPLPPTPPPPLRE